MVDTPSEKLQGMNVFWDVGLGTGNDVVGGLVTLHPKLISVSPNQASAGGAILTLNVQGVGVRTQGLTIVDDTGASACQSVKIVSYGVIKCHSVAKDIDTTLAVMLGGQVYNCANSDATKCKLKQQSQSLQTPVVTSAQVLNNNKIVFSGTNFP